MTSTTDGSSHGSYHRKRERERQLVLFDKNSSQYLAAVELKVSPKPTLTEQRVPISSTLPNTISMVKNLVALQLYRDL
jgi:hypothetical protein